MVITTKFDYGDDCWIMHANRPRKARVFGIQIAEVTKLNACRPGVHYTIRVTNSIGGFDYGDIELSEDYIFETKDKLLDSFR